LQLLLLLRARVEGLVNITWWVVVMSMPPIPSRLHVLPPSLPLLLVRYLLLLFLPQVETFLLLLLVLLHVLLLKLLILLVTHRKGRDPTQDKPSSCCSCCCCSSSSSSRRFYSGGLALFGLLVEDGVYCHLASGVPDGKMSGGAAFGRLQRRTRRTRRGRRWLARG
jgi:hypothetical protein